MFGDTRFLRSLILAGLAFSTISLAAATELRSMRRITPEAGWVLAGSHVLWTSNAGAQWTDITPPAAQERSVGGVFFADLSTGWVLRSGAEAGALELARTTDGGATWSLGAFPLSPEDAGRFGGTASLDFLDAQHGWAMLKQRSSSNFSLGLLFSTKDGGATWTKLPSPPLGDAVRFVTGTDGWVAGGPAGNKLFVTRDGGKTWTATPVSGRTVATYTLPLFSDSGHGALAVSYEGRSGVTTALYVTEDGGRSWQLKSSTTGKGGALAQFDSHALRLRADHGTVTTELDGKLAATAVTRAITADAAVVGADFSDAGHGWVWTQSGYCTGYKTGCGQQEKLLETSDSGRSFTDVTPAIVAATVPDAHSIGNGKGFDACSISSTSNMATWHKDSPYHYDNVYIGGENRGCGQPGLNSSWLNTVIGQGWKLIPTWVGLQAPGSSCSSCGKFSSNPSTAASQGTSEAAAAAKMMGALGLGHAVIYYDMEEYSEDAPSAVQAFVNAWVAGLHARGYVAGVYGSPSNAQHDWTPIKHKPNDVWIADWNGAASVGNIPGLNNGEWANHQRIHQYRGGNNETYGGVTFNVDNNFLDGAVTP